MLDPDPNPELDPEPDPEPGPECIPMPVPLRQKVLIPAVPVPQHTDVFFKMLVWIRLSLSETNPSGSIPGTFFFFAYIPLLYSVGSRLY
jgi:hypothetical protein